MGAVTVTILISVVSIVLLIYFDGKEQGKV